MKSIPFWSVSEFSVHLQVEQGSATFNIQETFSPNSLQPNETSLELQMLHGLFKNDDIFVLTFSFYLQLLK